MNTLRRNLSDPGDRVVPPRLSEELENLLRSAKGGPLSLNEIILILHGRGLPLIICILCMPFLFPIAIPGLSIPIGIAMALCGFRIALGKAAWLPDFLLRKKISYSTLEKLVRNGCKIYRKIEGMIHPRMFFLQRWPGMVNLIGLTIAFAAILLSLPIPPPFPFTNTIPALAIILLSLGLQERDGVLILCGYGLTLVAFSYVLIIVLLGKAGIGSLVQWLMQTF
ncbi:MAG: exopolysaccharide biosynthesis protein [Chthoniobacterales bacterium]